MARSKLRKMVVDGENYLWRFMPGYERTGEPLNSYQCHDSFVAYLEEGKTSPLQVHFITWEDAIIGGPLRTGAPVVPGNSNSAQLNLHTPKIAAEMIRGAIKRGWRPATDAKPFVIADGMTFLKEMGYEVE
jgi:hypothetical protein